MSDKQSGGWKSLCVTSASWRAGSGPRLRPARPHVPTVPLCASPRPRGGPEGRGLVGRDPGSSRAVWARRGGRGRVGVMELVLPGPPSREGVHLECQVCRRLISPFVEGCVCQAWYWGQGVPASKSRPDLRPWETIWEAHGDIARGPWNGYGKYPLGPAGEPGVMAAGAESVGGAETPAGRRFP